MPVYEYRCKECGQHLEVQQSFTDDPLTICEACGGPLRKVFGNVGISFKGSGFYKNDHGSRAKAGSSSSTTSDSSTSTSSDSSSTPAAPAAAPSTGSGSTGSGPSAPAAASST
jgi:putative FmdB family regulatory protein